MNTRPLVTDTDLATLDIGTFDPADRSVQMMHCDADGRRYAAPFRWRPRAVTSV